MSPSVSTIPCDQDFRGYTAVDPNARFTITACKIDVDGLTRDEDAWVVKDFGAGHFGNGLVHDVDVTPRACVSTGHAAVWGLIGNITIEDVLYHWNSDESAVFLMLYTNGTSWRWWARSCEDRAQDLSAYGTAVIDTTQYIRVKMPADDTVTVDIYSTAELRTADAGGDVDTLTLTLPGARSFRYVSATQSYDSSDPGETMSFDVENLDLNE